MAQDPEREAAERSEEEAVAATFRLAAQYIALSFALQPGRDVYARSLKVVRPLLPGATCAAASSLQSTRTLTAPAPRGARCTPPGGILRVQGVCSCKIMLGWYLLYSKESSNNKAVPGKRVCVRGCDGVICGKATKL